jgi:hypothetical protein
MKLNASLIMFVFHEDPCYITLPIKTKAVVDRNQQTALPQHISLEREKIVTVL